MTAEDLTLVDGPGPRHSRGAARRSRYHRLSESTLQRLRVVCFVVDHEGRPGEFAASYRYPGVPSSGSACTSTSACGFLLQDTATTAIHTLSLHDALPIAAASLSRPE